MSTNRDRREFKGRGVCADQHGNRVFKLIAALPQRGRFCLGRGEFGLGTRHVQFVADTAFKTTADQPDLFLA